MTKSLTILIMGLLIAAPALAAGVYLGGNSSIGLYWDAVTENLGIGTSTPFAAFSLVATTTAQTSLFALASSSSAGASAMPVFMVTKAGHIVTSGAKPNISLCGTTPSVTGSDSAGTITTGTALPLYCLLTFTTTFGAAPSCVISATSPQAQNGFIGTMLSSTTATTLGIMSHATTTGTVYVGMTSWLISYHCIGLQ